MTWGCEDGTVDPLMLSLKGGASPRLHRLELELKVYSHSHLGGEDERQKDTLMVVDALEVRRLLGTCRGLTMLKGKWLWSENPFEENMDVTNRLLQVLLPSIEENPIPEWSEKEAEIFKNICAPHLKKLDNESRHSLPQLIEALGSMMALEKISFDYKTLSQSCLEAFVDLCHQYKGSSKSGILLPNLRVMDLKRAFEIEGSSNGLFAAIGEAPSSVLVNLRKLKLEGERLSSFLPGFSFAVEEGAFAKLEKVEMYMASMNDHEAGLSDLCQALEGTACGKNLREIFLERCEVGPKGFKAFGGLLERGGLPSLRSLKFSSDRGIGSEGVCYLLESIKKAGCRSSSPLLLRELVLDGIGMNDENLQALVAILEEGSSSPLRMLKILDISCNKEIRAEGASLLTDAITADLLPMLETFECSGTGIAPEEAKALVAALVKHCPRMRKVHFPYQYTEEVRAEIAALVKERKGLKIIYRYRG